MGGDLGHVLGDEVHVLHGEHRELDADHPPHLARPEPTGVDDVLGVDRLADVGVHVPRAVGALAQAVDPRVAVHLGAGHAGADRVGVGDTGRIDVPLDRVVQRADEVLVLHEREQRLRLLRADQLELHAEVAAAGLGHPQEVHAHLGVGEHQPAGQVDAAVLAGHGLELLVELDRVLLQLRARSGRR